MFKSFKKKIEAEQFICQHPHLKLFCKDLGTNGAKEFIASTPVQIFKHTLKDKHKNYYEYYNNKQPVKMALDIDIDRERFKNISKKHFHKILKDSIRQINIRLPKRETNIIVLTAHRKNKWSSHVIFINTIFASILHAKKFMKSIPSNIIKRNFIDLSIYRVGCFRLYLNNKKGKQNPLIFYKGFGYEFKNHKTTFKDCLLTNVKHIKRSDYIKLDLPQKTIFNRPENKITNNEGKTIDITNTPASILTKYLNLLGDKFGNNYTNWTKIGMLIYNCNNTRWGFEAWNNWSSKFDKYKGRNECLKLWNTFKLNKLGFGTLKYITRKYNLKDFNKLEYNIPEPKFKTIKFNKNYNLNLDENIKDKKSLLAKYIDKWATSKKIKSLSLKAPYNTGKTTMIHKFIQEYDPTSVLIITYRQSLTNALYGEFKDLNVKSYMDKEFNANRLICQIESLYKIENICEEIKSFDLVIIDEIESALAHFTSPTIKYKETTFDLLYAICHNAGKLLALDGDYHNRAYDFINTFGKHIVLENTIKKDKSKYIFSKDSEQFKADIDKDLQEGKNIVLISMSSKMAKYYQEEFKQYTSLLHYSQGDDKLKRQLKDVNNLWKKYQLVLYTPCVESGVDFNTPHFYKKYIILSAQSCSPRAVCQMASRIRQTENNEINVLLNRMPYKTQANFYTYDEVYEIPYNIHHKYTQPTIQLNTETNKYIMDSNNKPYTKLWVYNHMELLNKNPSYFVPMLLQLLKNKGCKYEYVESNNKNHKTPDITKQDILEARDIEMDEYDYLKRKQRNNQATRQDKMAVEKHVYKLKYKEPFITSEFLDKYFRKERQIDNLKKIMNIRHNEVYDKTRIDLDKAKEQEKLIMIEDLINNIGFDLKNFKIRLNLDSFKKATETSKNKALIFTNTLKTQTLFGFNKGKIHGIKSFMGFVNTLLNRYGLKVKRVSKIKKEKINNKWVSKRISSYSLDFHNNLDRYIYRDELDYLALQCDDLYLKDGVFPKDEYN